LNRGKGTKDEPTTSPHPEAKYTVGGPIDKDSPELFQNHGHQEPLQGREAAQGIAQRTFLQFVNNTYILQE
jgi:hypothetical protein